MEIGFKLPDFAHVGREEFEKVKNLIALLDAAIADEKKLEENVIVARAGKDRLVLASNSDQLTLVRLKISSFNARLAAILRDGDPKRTAEQSRKRTERNEKLRAEDQARRRLERNVAQAPNAEFIGNEAEKLNALFRADMVKYSACRVLFGQNFRDLQKLLRKEKGEKDALTKKALLTEATACLSIMSSCIYNL